MNVVHGAKYKPTPVSLLEGVVAVETTKPGARTPRIGMVLDLDFERVHPDKIYVADPWVTRSCSRGPADWSRSSPSCWSSSPSR